MKGEMIQGYVLHARPWRETSLLLDLWTTEGRLSAIAKGARRPKSAQRHLLQPLTPLNLSWSGRGEVKTLTQVDGDGVVGTWRDEALYSGLYSNELIVRTVLPGEPQLVLFNAYQQLLHSLVALPEPVQRVQLEQLLRAFELSLLQQLGYGLNLKYTGTGEPVDTQLHYEFRHGEGLCPARETASISLSGAHIHAFAQGDLQDDQVRRSARNLLRLALRPLLGEQPLYSRQLFRAQG